MAARRLLIVMLVLLGLSTLAAALVPQHSLRDGTTSGTTTTQPTESTTTPAPNAGRSLSVEIVVGGKKVPVVADVLCKKRKPKCEPLHVGDQLSLEVLSRGTAQLEIPAFGLIGVASHNSPAFFQLLPHEPATIGVLFTSPLQNAPECKGAQKTCNVAARIEVLSAKEAAKAIRKPKSKKKAKKKS